MPLSTKVSFASVVAALAMPRTCTLPRAGCHRPPLPLHAVVLSRLSPLALVHLSLATPCASSFFPPAFSCPLSHPPYPRRPLPRYAPAPSPSLPCPLPRLAWILACSRSSACLAPSPLSSAASALSASTLLSATHLHAFVHALPRTQHAAQRTCLGT